MCRSIVIFSTNALEIIVTTNVNQRIARMYHLRAHTLNMWLGEIGGPCHVVSHRIIRIAFMTHMHRREHSKHLEHT